MKFDVVIVGGGLGGLVCGVRLQRSGLRCVIVSGGQNSMHFSSGAFGLLSHLPDGTPVDDPIGAIERLPAGHPYRILGKERVVTYALSIKEFFASVGIPLVGDPLSNSYMITPVGRLKRTWLALSDVTLLKDPSNHIADKALIVNFKGFMDFNTGFLQSGLDSLGISSRIAYIDFPALESLRANPSEMRSVSIARILDREDNAGTLLNMIVKEISDEDLVVLPSVFGLMDDEAVKRVAALSRAKTLLVGTMPPSVPGIRCQMLLKRAFEASGGTFLFGDVATGSQMKEDIVTGLRTANLSDVPLQGDAYVISTGSFFSRGLVSDSKGVSEPLFGLDVDTPPQRGDWYGESFFSHHPYMGFGVNADTFFHPFKNGWPVENLWAVGSILGGCDALSTGSGAGVTLMTAFAAADSIIERLHPSDKA